MPEKKPQPDSMQAVKSLEAITGRINKLISKLKSLGDRPISAELAKEAGDIASEIRSALAPPSSQTEKSEFVWPKDLSAEAAGELDWGVDPEGLHG